MKEEIREFWWLRKAMDLNSTVNDALEGFGRILRNQDAWKAACEDAKAHYAGIHEHALLPAMDLAVATAFEIEKLTNFEINVIVPMALCDIGKVGHFLRNLSGKGDGRYVCSENKSAEVAYKNGLTDPDDLGLIIKHKLGFQAKPETIIATARKERVALVANALNLPLHYFDPSKNSDGKWLARLLAVFACRCVARGWTDMQCRERPQEADKVRAVCALWDADETNEEKLGTLGETLGEIILRDKPLPDTEVSGLLPATA